MVYDKRESCKGYIKEEISMPRTKTTKAAVTKTTKAAATEKIDLYQAGKYKTETEQVFREFSNSFGEIMVPFMTRFNADMLVIGGGMVLSEQYFLPLISQYMKANGINASIMTVADTTTAIIAGAAALCDLI